MKRLVFTIFLILGGCAGIQTPEPTSANICKTVCALHTTMSDLCVSQNQSIWGVVQYAVDMIDCLNKCEGDLDYLQSINYVCLYEQYAEFTVEPDTCPNLTPCF